MKVTWFIKAACLSAICALAFLPVRAADGSQASQSNVWLAQRLRHVPDNQYREGASTSYAVVHSGKIVAQGTFGYSDLERSARAHPGTAYAIGSITKQFTALIIMQLVEQHKLSIAEPATHYLPELRGFDGVTISQLLRHRSGLPDYLSGNLGQMGQPLGPLLKRHVTPLGIIQTILGKKALFTPGSDYAYSNTDYVALGLIAERVTHVALHELYRRRIFSRANLRNTTFISSRKSDNIAVGYDDLVGVRASSPDPSWFFAVGDILSTAPDIARFDIALMEGQIVRTSTLASMLPSTVEGIAFFRTAFGGLPLVGHHGGIPGYESDNEIISGIHDAVVVLSNFFDNDTEIVLRRCLTLLYPDRARVAPSSVNEDVAVTRLLLRFLSSMQSGVFPSPEMLTPPYRKALTPQVRATLTKTFRALGPVKHAIFRGPMKVGAVTVYNYDIVFAGESLPVVFTLDKRRRIDGF